MVKKASKNFKNFNQKEPKVQLIIKIKNVKTTVAENDSSAI